MRSGFTVWLTGCPGAGKTTVARSLADQLRSTGRGVEVLDGDDVRRAISPDLGFSRSDRDLNVQRLGYIAGLLSRNGVAAIVAAVSPYRAARDRVRHSHEAPFIEVFVDCSIEELIRRDQKGLYSGALRGDVAAMTGVSDPYERPLAPEVHLHTDREPAVDCSARVVRALVDRHLIGVPADHDVTAAAKVSRIHAMMPRRP